MQKFSTDEILAALSLILLGVGCALVLWPFLTAMIWAAILVSTSWPAFMRVDKRLGGRRLLAASLMTLLVTCALLAPILVVALGLADNISELANAITALVDQGLPDAPEWLLGIPWIGVLIHDHWQPLAHDGARLVEALKQFAEPAQTLALAGGRAMGKGVIDMALSVFLAFFFFLYGETLAARLRVTLEHLAGGRAMYLLNIARGTVTGVIYGILGTGLAQGMLAAIGFAIAGVPAAALLGVATFFLSVMPVGPPLVWGGAAIWLFQQGQPGWAVFVALWGFFLVSTVDNIIKPFIISRGAQMPFAIVFLGVLGGVLAFGVIGAFLGPTLLAVGYRLAIEWTNIETPAVSSPDANEQPMTRK